MLQSITHNSIGKNDVVAFKLAGQDFCIDIGLVREIRGWAPATVLPHAPPYIKGVINLRGAVVAVVDLAARLGFAPTEPSPRHVIIIVLYDGKVVGLLAELVSDIVTIDDAQIRAVPDIASDPSREFISGMATFDDGRILRKIDLAQLLPGTEGFSSC
ncbi:purine-binding chemotaxis protein CheW [Ketogulonicigenium robustum]|uniref:Purine-binding chemotaxis protein CheW n=1 Tax=Ketogulonicigenium robustum TaxID=92947 RepID=A0A1W6P012_9RHOB|nr:chemotaxis protein CheW [Ketogulonicigenium robustum]ARO14845.1 purine-binding chemotaxis protein CheW [Ketogulonicigenium robustum]